MYYYSLYCGSLFLIFYRIFYRSPIEQTSPLFFLAELKFTHMLINQFMQWIYRQNSRPTCTRDPLYVTNIRQLIETSRCLDEILYCVNDWRLDTFSITTKEVFDVWNQIYLNLNTSLTLFDCPCFHLMFTE